MSSYQLPKFDPKELMEKLLDSPILKDDGDYFTMKCPFPGHKKQPREGKLWCSTRNNSLMIGCTKHHPSAIGLWDFLEEHYSLPNLDLLDTPEFDETILFICDTLGIEPQLRTDTSFDDSVVRKREVRELYRDIELKLKRVSFTPEDIEKDPSIAEHYNIEDRTYRGIPVEVLLNSYGVGMLDSAAFKDLNTKYNTDVWTAAGLNFSNKVDGLYNQWLLSGVILLRYSDYGQPCGLTKRNYFTDRKYSKNKNTNVLMDEVSYLFNYNTAKKANKNTLFVVEGEFDALALAARGLPNVVAYNKQYPGEEQAVRLEDLNCRLVFILDRDGGEKENILRISHRLPNAYFLLLEKPEDQSSEKIDIDAYLRNIGDIDSLYSANTLPNISANMWAETNDDIKWVDKKGTATKYFDIIVDEPTIDDDINIHYLSILSDKDYDKLYDSIMNKRAQKLLVALGSHSKHVTINVN